MSALPLADRATIGNMSPEFGSTCAIFPIDAETLRYLAFSGRPPELIELVEAYAKEQGLWHDEHAEEPTFSDTVELDLGDVVPSLAGPKRPQDRVSLSDAKESFRGALGELLGSDAQAVANSHDEASPRPSRPATRRPHGAGSRAARAARAGRPGDRRRRGRRRALGDRRRREDGRRDVQARPRPRRHRGDHELHEHLQPVGDARRRAAGAQRPGEGLQRQPWVKTSLAPGSKVVTEYLERAGVQEDLDALGFNLVGYGCTTCIGNSGPLPDEISAAVNDADLAVASVLSGNRNFEGRINPDVKMNYLASPPLVVAYALAGTMDCDLVNDPIGQTPQGEDVHLRDIWPSTREIAAAVEHAVQSDMFRKSYGQVFAGDERWNGLDVPTGDRFAWDDGSTYVQRPPYFDGMPREPEPVRDVEGARVLAKLGDSITTDHISPAGAIKRGGPAARYLEEHGVTPRDFNSFGARRGNHEVMVRGTFANIRLRNLLGAGGPLRRAA